MEIFCPKCGGQFKKIDDETLPAFRCQTCSGLWFTSQPKSDTDIDLATKIDVGDPTIGKIYDLLSDVDCPSCKTKLATVCDPIQEHIQYEICGSCYGVYFDAGEFSDFVLKEENLSKLRDLMWKKRS